MSSYVVYLLRNEAGRTYVGSTCALPRRLRQHNGELAGGARQTAGRGPWTVAKVVRGFHQRREALQFEFAWRRVHRRRRCAYTLAGRERSLTCLLALARWSRNAPPAEEVPLVVEDHQTDDEGGGFFLRGV